MNEWMNEWMNEKYPRKMELRRQSGIQMLQQVFQSTNLAPFCFPMANRRCQVWNDRALWIKMWSCFTKFRIILLIIIIITIIVIPLLLLPLPTNKYGTCRHVLSHSSQWSSSAAVSGLGVTLPDPFFNSNKYLKEMQQKTHILRLSTAFSWSR